MLSNRDEVDTHKLVVFYISYTCVYFPAILLVLYWTNSIYTVGRYSFQTVLAIILCAEVVKYLASAVYLKRNEYSLMKKHEDASLLAILKRFLSKAGLKEGCKTFFTFCTMIVIYFILSVLYGAEIFGKHEETLMFSALLSVLTVFPTCVNLGCLSVVSIFLGCRPSDRLESLLYQNLYLTLLGAWLGAFVIPLDWDRPWQEWPIPCSCGAMVGFLVSHVLMTFRTGKVTTKKKLKC